MKVLALLALVAGCSSTEATRVARTVQVGYGISRSEFDSTSTFSDRTRHTDGDSDGYSIWISVQPLAFLEDPPAHATAFVPEEQPEPEVFVPDESPDPEPEVFVAEQESCPLPKGHDTHAAPVLALDRSDLLVAGGALLASVLGVYGKKKFTARRKAQKG